MYSAWESANPILFGCGTSKLTGKKLKALGCTKVLVLYDMGIKNAGIVDPILETLTAEGLEYVCYDNVQADPPDWSCDEAAALGTENGCDGILGIGGGSSMDTAKGARLVMAFGAPVNDHFMVMGAAAKPESEMCPIVVIPTTSGTGSEASPGGVITNTRVEPNYKAITSVNVSLGIVDPELTLGLPAGITANTGVDAFTHAAEALTSSMPNAIAAVLGKESCRLIFKYLPIACKDGKNVEAREALAKASCMATISMRGPFGGLPHNFGGGISKLFHKAHGITVGIFMGPMFPRLAQVVPDQVKLIADAMELEYADDISNEDLGKLVYDAWNAFLDEVNFPKFSDICDDKQFLLDNVDAFYQRPNPFSPWNPKDQEEAKAIIAEAYDAR